MRQRISGDDRVLIMKPSSLGDIVHTIPVVQALKRQLPSVHISWFVLEEYKPLVDLLVDVDESVAFRRHGFKDDPWGYVNSQVRTVIKLRSCRFDWVLDFQGLFRSGFFSYLSGAPKRFGFRWKNEPNTFFYNIRTKVDKGEHALVRTIKLAEGLGIRVIPEDLVARFKSHRLRRFDLPAGRNIVFCPGGRWTTKRWPAKNYAELAQFVIEKLGMNVIVVGSRVESYLGDVVERKAEKGVVNLAGKTSLKDLPYILDKAEAVVTNDSGPMHLAAALGKKVFALFGPTDPSRTGPYGEEHVVFKADIDCRPCFKKVCDRDMECMKDITVEKVAETLRQVMGPE